MSRTPRDAPGPVRPASSLTWSDYYRATAGRAPRDLFTRAMDIIEAGGPGYAIDLGCGDGTETVPLLASGWRVLATDREAEAIELLLSRVPADAAERLSVRVGGFEEIEFPRADFIYAGLSLFFTPPAHFPGVWARLRAALEPSGRIAAHFLGERDTWAADPALTHHDEPALRALLEGMEIEWWQETENDVPAVSGPKHWHIFKVIARAGRGARTPR